jgi:hypothetical protein
MVYYLALLQDWPKETEEDYDISSKETSAQVT